MAKLIAVDRATMYTGARVTIFTRHSSDCRFAGDETRNQCKCWKHVRWFGFHPDKPGDLRKRQHREPTNCETLAGAERVKREWEIKLDPKIAPEEAAITTDQAIKDFMLYKQTGNGISESQTRKYNLDFKRFTEFFAQRNRFYLGDITLTDLVAFRATWDKYYKNWDSRRGAQTRIKSLFLYMHNAGRIHKNPAIGLDAIEGEFIQTEPLTDEEYKNLLKTIEEHYVDADLMHRARTIIRVMRHTGMAVGDAVRLKRDRLIVDRDGDPSISIKRRKTQKKRNAVVVSIPIPKDLADDLAKVKSPSSDYFFWTGDSTSIGQTWAVRISNLMDRAGIKPGKTQMRSHRLRDTFAIDMLKHGVPMEEVSQMLCHSDIRITQRHYAAWVPERQNRLNNLVKATF